MMGKYIYMLIKNIFTLFFKKFANYLLLKF